MSAHIRPLQEHDVQALVDLSLRAWAPVHEFLRIALGPRIFDRLYPDWRKAQEDDVRNACADEDMRVWVAEVGGTAVGFISVVMRKASGVGVIDMVAVDPDHQNAGIATDLTAVALQVMRDSGMRVAMVEAGGDPGHLPARRTYEKASFTLLPIARYFKPLDAD